MALTFDGINDYAMFGIRSPGLLQSTPFSIALTFRTPSVITAADQVIVCLGTVTQTSNSTHSGAAILIRADGTFGAHSFYGLERKLNTTVVAQPNTTYRLVLTKDSGQNAKLYINTLANVFSYGVFSTYKLGDVLVAGCRWQYVDSQIRFASGSISRLAFWPSVISSSDITYVLTDGNVPSGATVAPAEYWPLSSQLYSNFLTGNIGVLYNDPVLNSNTLSTATIPVVTAVGTNYEAALGSSTSITLEGMTAATSATLFGRTLSGFSGSDSTYTVNLPGLVDEVTSPLGLSQIIISDGVKSSLATINILPPTGYSSVVLTNGFQTGSNSIVYNWSPSAVVGDWIVYPNIDNNSVDSQAILTTDHVGSQTFWHIQKSTGIARSFNVITGSNTVSINLLSLLPNTTSPIFDGAYITGNRP